MPKYIPEIPFPLKSKFTLSEFETYVSAYRFGSIPPSFLVLHHTWKPTKKQWKGKETLDGIDKYYRSKGWKGRGPHLFIAEDGIWTFTPMYDVGIHAGKGNGSVEAGYSVGIEIVGDYDGEKWSGETKTNALGAISILKKQLKLNNEKIYFHNEFSSKTCPGRAITKEWLFEELEKFENPVDYNLKLENQILREENKYLANRLQSVKDFVSKI